MLPHRTRSSTRRCGTISGKSRVSIQLIARRRSRSTTWCSVTWSGPRRLRSTGHRGHRGQRARYWHPVTPGITTSRSARSTSRTLGRDRERLQRSPRPASCRPRSIVCPRGVGGFLSLLDSSGRPLSWDGERPIERRRRAHRRCLPAIVGSMHGCRWSPTRTIPFTQARGNNADPGVPCRGHPTCAGEGGIGARVLPDTKATTPRAAPSTAYLSFSRGRTRRGRRDHRSDTPTFEKLAVAR